MEPTPLPARGLAEAYLYVVVTPCPACRRGFTRPCGGFDVQYQTTWSANLRVVCDDCGAEAAIAFTLGMEPAPFDVEDIRSVGNGESPSRIIDVGQWLTLHSLFAAQSEAEHNASRKRRLNLLANLCVAEALLFYDDPGNDLPPSGALFTDASRERFRSFPQYFSQARLRSLQERLPRATPSEAAPKRSPLSTPKPSEDA
ncbi:MAG: hypothetical protein AABZ12_08245 [Planctomycetota bacterium]